MELKGGKGYTIADIEALPEGERAKLIEKEMFRMDASVKVHQRILMRLAFEIELFIRNHKGRCEVLPSPFAVYIKKDNPNYVEPDISVICDRNKLDEKGCQGTNTGSTETVTVYDFEHGKEPVRYSFSEPIKAGIFTDLWLNLSEMDLG